MPLTLPKLRRSLPLIKQAIFHTIVPLDGTRYLPDVPASICSPSALRDAPWQPIRRGETWGRPMHTVWLRQPLEIPAELRDERVAVHLRWRDDATQWSPDMIESQLFIDDTLWAGLDAEHRLAFLPQLNEPVEIFVQAHAGLAQPFGGLELVVIDGAVEKLYHTLRTGIETVEQIELESYAGSRLLARLSEAYRLLDLRESIGPRFRESVCAANEFLDRNLLEGFSGGPRPQMVVTGHAHIDVAWLWPLWRTRQKTAHTFATMLRLMDEYPDYCFTASTPQLYQFVKDDAPDLYDQIKARVAEGRWEPIGGMWVEADCNIPSGESLVRQFLHGMRFFAEEFGIRDRVLWMPDVFGYSAALPQIMRGCGIDTFMTTKISWSQFNRMPHDTFRWRGIDGTEVLTHFVTTIDKNHKYYTYNGFMTPSDVAGAWEVYRQKTINDELLYLMGYGDGGGGPTREQIETAQRLHDMPDMPQVRFGTANDYFRRLHDRVGEHARLPIWTGELYLEYHRGTYTSQAHIKQANRRSEQLYHDAEFLDAWAATLPGYESQRAKLNQGWQLILMNQFHDILPGSSIREVYDDAEADYATVARIGGEVRDAALAALTATSDASLLAVNTLGWQRSDPLFVSEALWAAVASSDLLSQPIRRVDGTAGVLVAGQNVPAYGILELKQTPSAIDPPELSISPTLLENHFFRIALDSNGEIESIFDKRYKREVIAPGQRANALVAFEDRPLDYDAWDIDHFFEEKPYPVQQVESIEVVENGPVRGGIEIVRRFLNSTIRQRVLIYSTLDRIDVQTEIDWHEHQVLLKAAFPVNINATRATYEIQFGAVERPTHRNTSWDMARFETCAQRWIDLSEGDYGVALLNDSKYGHDLHHNVMRLTLLKSGIYPDPNADQGVHRFTYALVPHAGDWRAGEVVRRAAELNTPLIATRGAGEQQLNASQEDVAATFAVCDAPHVVLDTIKTAEDGDGLIVRLYEAHNARGPVTLTFNRPIAHAERCNLLEERTDAVEIDDCSARFEINPFEIVTLRVRLG